MIECPEADYSEPVAPMDRGNPLILALPDFPRFSINEIVQALTDDPEAESIPEVLEGRASKALLSQELRNRMARCFVPLATHLVLQRNLDAIMRAGYQGRNPLKPRIGNEMRNVVVSKDGKAKIGKHKPRARQDPAGGSLIGCSGLGKSYAIENVLSLYEHVIHHSEYGFWQVVYLRVDYPPDGKSRSLCISILAELDRIFLTNKAEEYGNARIDTLLNVVVASLENYHVGLLVIDEFQNILADARPNGSGVKEETFNFIVSLSNSSGVPIIFVGTPRSYRFLGNRLRVARRAGETIDWRRPKASDLSWKEFMNSLWAWRVIDRDVPVMPDDLREALYAKSQGITDLAVRLFFQSQNVVIRAVGSPQWDAKAVNAAFNLHFKPLAALISRLAAGEGLDDDDWSSEYEAKVGSAEKQAEEEFKLALAADEKAKAHALRGRVRRLSNRLALLGIGPELATKEALEALLAKHPDADFETLLQLAEQTFLPEENKGRTAPAEELKDLKQFDASDDLLG